MNTEGFVNISKRRCYFMEDKEKNAVKEAEVKTEEGLSPTWNEDCLTELDEWIESQGIYLRQ